MKRVLWAVTAMMFVGCLSPVSDGPGDGGSSNTDGGSSNTDGGSNNSDAGSSNTDAGASNTDGGSAACDASVLNGHWVRAVDRFGFVVTTQGCAISGTGDVIPPGYAHTLAGTFVLGAVTSPITIQRVSPATSCRTEMRGVLTLLDPTQFLISVTSTDGRCDLPTSYNEASTFVKQ